MTEVSSLSKKRLHYSETKVQQELQKVLEEYGLQSSGYL